MTIEVRGREIRRAGTHPQRAERLHGPGPGRGPDELHLVMDPDREDREGEEEHELREPGARRASCGAAMYGFGQLVHPTGAWSSFIDRAPLEL